MARKMNYTPEKLTLPMFLMKVDRLQKVLPDYIKQLKDLYASKCFRERRKWNASKAKHRHVLGLEAPLERKCYHHPATAPRMADPSKPWELSPNRYNLTAEPYARLQGLKGAHWSTLIRWQKSARVAMHFDISHVSWDVKDRCNPARGVFRTGTRKHRYTARSAVMSPLHCYKRPEDADATTYNPLVDTLAYNLSPKRTWPRSNPHLFYRQSCVPLHNTLPRDRDVDYFPPGPGRYDTRGREWAHVPGKGHKHVFKNIPPAKTFKLRTKKVFNVKMLQRIHLRHSPSYLSMTKNPQRTPLSIRDEQISRRPYKFRFHCKTKVHSRKNNDNFQKPTFNSLESRFPGIPRATPLTKAQLREVKASLPPELQLRDHPIMEKSLSQIKLKVYDPPPEHLKPLYKPMLRKKLYKFASMPKGKILVRDVDVLGKPNAPKPRYESGCYGGNLPTSDFLKDIKRVNPRFHSIYYTL